MFFIKSNRLGGKGCLIGMKIDDTTRADAEQVEKERDAYRDECITRGGRELQSLCDKEQAIRDAVEMARLAEDLLIRTREVEVNSSAEHRFMLRVRAIIDRYEGGDW